MTRTFRTAVTDEGFAPLEVLGASFLFNQTSAFIYKFIVHFLSFEMTAINGNCPTAVLAITDLACRTYLQTVAANELSPICLSAVDVLTASFIADLLGFNFAPISHSDRCSPFARCVFANHSSYTDSIVVNTLIV
jgi:hypothetical protein